MQPTYKALLSDADHGDVSPVCQFTQGVGTIVVYGTMPTGNRSVILEVSHDGTNFAPLTGFDQIQAEFAGTFTLAHGIYVRLRVEDHPSASCSVTAVMC